MPRYFFHVDDGRLAPDRVGLDLPDLEAVRGEAVTAAGSMICEAQNTFWEHRRPFVMHVVDSDHRLLFTLAFEVRVPSGEARFVPRSSESEEPSAPARSQAGHADASLSGQDDLPEGAIPSTSPPRRP